MNEREALLRAVCESPDDDTPRLVFADWLQEHGEEERAEFIRLQCWIRTLPAFDDVDDLDRQLFAERGPRSMVLENKNRTRWLSELPAGQSPELVWCPVFDRGFAGKWLVVRAHETEVPGDGPWGRVPRWEGDAAHLDWDRIYAATPLQELALVRLWNWSGVLRPIGARSLSCLMLVGCRVTGEAVRLLTHWLRSSAARLIVAEDDNGPYRDWHELETEFGDRIQLADLWPLQTEIDDRIRFTEGLR